LGFLGQKNYMVLARRTIFFGFEPLLKRSYMNAGGTLAAIPGRVALVG